MKNKNIYLGALLLLLASCGNFLEPKSKSEFVPKETSSLNELLLGEAYPRYDVGKMNVFLGLLDDDIACVPFQEVEEGSQNRSTWYPAFTWQPDMYVKMKDSGFDSYDIYETYYARILGANAALDYLENISGTENEKNLVKAQALTLRAFFYLTLVNLYGAPYNTNKEALGVSLKLNSGIEDKAIERSTVEEVYAQIVKDLTEAERLYKTEPADMQWRKDYRTSLPMVQLLLSRVYLYMENWTLAAKYAATVINDYSFRLLDLNDIADSIPQEWNPAIKTAYYINYYTYDSPEVIWMYGNIGDVTKMIAQLGKFNNNTQTAHSMFKASDELIACFDHTPGDLRKSRYVVWEAEPSYDDNYRIYYVPQPFGKFAITNDNEFYRPAAGTQAFARALRLSEAYLNLAEAAAMNYQMTGDGQSLNDSRKALSALRTHRFPTPQIVDITDAGQLIRLVRDERRRELCFEDHRWFDLRRWGMKEMRHKWVADEQTTELYILQERDAAFTLPLPDEVLNLNRNLVQNPLAPVRKGTKVDN